MLKNVQLHFHPAQFKTNNSAYYSNVIRSHPCLSASWASDYFIVCIIYNKMPFLFTVFNFFCKWWYVLRHIVKDKNLFQVNLFFSQNVSVQPLLPHTLTFGIQKAAVCHRILCSHLHSHCTHLDHFVPILSSLPTQLGSRQSLCLIYHGCSLGCFLNNLKPQGNGNFKMQFYSHQAFSLMGSMMA